MKWIALDMDGTLLDGEDRILPRTKECLIECQKRGVRVILASGRSYTRLMPYARQLELENYGGRLIEVNGTAVYDLQNGKRRIIRRFRRDEILELFSFCRECQVEVQCFQDTAVYYWIPEWQAVKKEEERIQRGLPEDYPNLGGAWSWIADTRNGYPLQVQIEDESGIPEEMNKVNCCADEKTNEEVYRRLKERFGDRFEMVRTCPRLIEISPAGVTKGQALRMMMEEEGVSPEEVWVFGDGENDVDMFRAAGRSFAMGNAEEYVKEQASDVTLSNWEEGIAAVLENYLNI